MKNSVLLSMMVAVSLFSASAQADSQVYVVHGIDGRDLGGEQKFPVDIAVNGKCAIPDFTFGEIEGAIELPTGEYDIAISPFNENEPCGSEAILTLDDVLLDDLRAYSIVAHLTEAGDPTISAFGEDLSAIGQRTRMSVHHTAAAPMVDIQFTRLSDDRTLNFSDVENGDEGDVVLTQRRWSVEIFNSADDSSVLGPLKLELRQFSTYLIYAVGTPDNDTFTVLVRTVTNPSNLFSR